MCRTGVFGGAVVAVGSGIGLLALMLSGCSGAAVGDSSADSNPSSGSAPASVPNKEEKMYVITDDGEIVLKEGATEEDLAEATAEQERILGDRKPRVVDDADLVLDEQAGTVRIGGLLLEYPGFSSIAIGPKDDIQQSITLARDLPVLHFLELKAKDEEATKAFIEANGREDSLGVYVGMAVLKQTTQVTEDANRTNSIDRLMTIFRATDVVYSGSVGDFRVENQCWIDVLSDVPSGGESVEFVVSFAGPEIASSTMLVSASTASPSWPLQSEFVSDMATQACGAVPEGFTDAKLG